MEGKVSLRGSMFPVINFAMHQNYVPVVRNIIITNQTETVLEPVSVSVVFEPEFAHPFEQALGALQPHIPMEIAPVPILVAPEYLLSLTEKMVGNIHISVRMGDEVLSTFDSTIELLAYDEWGGISMMPEMISAFVTPNHPKVMEVVAKAGLFLNKWLKNPSFTGYQSENPNVVKHQMAAIYAALQQENVAYMPPPASFEATGQRVRFPGDVLEQKMGTCIDLSTLYASCLEAVGLHPILLFIQGHAFCGCWLDEQSFAEPVQDDISAITKRIADGIDEICLLECTGFIAGSATDFDEAVTRANAHLRKEEDFTLAVDVHRSRAGGIRPVPMRAMVNGAFTAVDYGERKKAQITSAPQEIDISVRQHAVESAELTKQKVWERRLLDLSLRNMLLSFRVTKNTVQLMASNLATLEDALANGDNFRLLPKPGDWENTLRDAKMYSTEHNKDALEQLVAVEFKNKRIRTFVSADELEQNLKSLHRNAKVSLEENGSNTLYLALGVLRWYETDISERARYAPLVLLPVELVRRVTANEYTLRIRDEEPQMNITLLELLKQDFGISITGLDPLPVDESGIDLKFVYSTIRQAVMTKKRWEVEELAFLGLFSFNQYIMWNDIRVRSHDLEQNKIVRSLIAGKMDWEPQENLLREERLDAQLSPSELAVPISADASQLAAIYAAAAGNSFVLHGPPGTGKSQTITNVIANALFQGKSVLFVAQKMAALSVVQKRLANIGLDPFCLELHSNKARKRDVLDQLEKTLSFGRTKEPEEYLEKAAQLQKARAQLNTTIEALHEKRNYGFSLFEAITFYEENAALRGAIRFTKPQIEAMGPQTFALWRDVVQKLSIAAMECGAEIATHPLRLFGLRQYSLSVRNEISGSIQTLKELLVALQDYSSALCNGLGMPHVSTYAQLVGLKRFAQTLLACPVIPPEMAENFALRQQDEAIRQTLVLVQQKNSEEQALLRVFTPQVYAYNATDGLTRLQKAQQSWFLAKTMGIGKIVKELSSFATAPNTVTKENVGDLLLQLQKRAQLMVQIEVAQPIMQQTVGALWQGAQTDAPALLAVYEAVIALQNAAGAALPNERQAAQLLAYAAGLLPLQQNPRARMEDFAQCMAEVEQTVGNMQKAQQIDMEATFVFGNWPEQLHALLDEWALHIDGLRAWCTFVTLCDEAKAAGIENVAVAFAGGKLSPQNAMQAFVGNLFLECAMQTIASVPQLFNFQGAQFEETIRTFKQLSTQFSSLTMQQLVAKLSAKIPTTSAGLANSSEIGILQRTIKSGGRAMPVRKLFDSIPNLLRRLCPCMLMSPISVAQYIDPSFPKFDLVIFDEASQVPTSEAVGAIARGENVLVVGDPKQLPPTSFFASNHVDEENFEKEDLESLLDDCLALSMPQEYLLWHYRSRHESLIAYSNQKYYENRLFTFPSPNDITSQVQFVPVEGRYDRGGTKQNRAEAQAVVQEICRRLADPVLREESIGVVTFSSVQQILIDDLLSEAFRANPELYEINNACYEPVFIKNLENVQGDERDVILFSIGYGPDKDGKVALNFGPLNREGGWRRLNVAISRARKHMLIYSTLRPEQIDLSRTRAEGLAGLKGFLEYAINGKGALPQNVATAQTTTAPMEQIIAAHISQQGYTVQCNIGCSGYKIDIGIVHPQRPQEYVLGILCDGNSYRTAKTANDRNIGQPGMLASLGWNLHRVWIMDWLDSPERETRKIMQEIEHILAREQKQQEGTSAATTSAAAPAAAVQFEKIDAVEEIKPSYEFYAPVLFTAAAPTETFYAPQTAQHIVSVANTLITQEGPIARAVLLRKVLNAWGITRTGSRVEAIVDDALAQLRPKQTGSGDGIFYWAAGQNPEEYTQFRVPKEGDDKRSMDEIAPEEIANAIRAVLKVQISLPRADLVREVAKVFGFTRIGSVIETAVQQGIVYAQKQGYVLLSADGMQATTAQ